MSARRHPIDPLDLDFAPHGIIGFGDSPTRITGRAYRRAKRWLSAELQSYRRFAKTPDGKRRAALIRAQMTEVADAHLHRPNVICVQP